MFKLLSTANPKIQKGTKFGYLSFILHLAPSDVSGYNTCPKATAGCRAAWVNRTGTPWPAELSPVPDLEVSDLLELSAHLAV